MSALPAEELTAHPVCAMFPMMSVADLDVLGQDILDNGLLDPIVVWMGQILDGRNRLAACLRAEVDPEFREWDGEARDIVPWILSRNLHRRHLEIGQRAMVASRLQETWSALPPDQRPVGKLRELAAAALHVSSGSVTYATQVRAGGDADLVTAVDQGEVPVSVAAAQVRSKYEQGLDQLDAEDRRARVNWTGEALLDDAATRRAREHLLQLARRVGFSRFFELVQIRARAIGWSSSNELEVTQGEPGAYGIREALSSLERIEDLIDNDSNDYNMSDEVREISRGPDEAAVDSDAARLSAPDPDVPISEAQNYDGDSWSTPPEILDDARALFGGSIDLDPATHPAAQLRVDARACYTKETNGLEHEWHGKVWLNPPYSFPLVQQFALKLIAEYDAARVTEALILVNNATSAKWFQALLARFPACFFEGRIAFLYDDGAKAGARQGQALMYLGPNVQDFRRIFGGYGVIVGAMS